MALIRSRIADVAGRRGNHAPVDERERRIHLLDLWQPGDGRAPHAFSVGDGDLADFAVGRRGIDELPVGIGYRSGVGDLFGAKRVVGAPLRIHRRSFVEAGRREFPQHLGFSGIDGNRAAEVGRAEKDVVRCAVDLDTAQVDEARVDRSGDGHLLTDHPSNIRSCNASRRHVGVGARVVAAKGRPFRVVRVVGCRRSPATLRQHQAPCDSQAKYQQRKHSHDVSIHSFSSPVSS